MSWIKKLLGMGDAQMAKKQMKKGSAVIDVRTVKEFQSGHLPNSINIPLDEVHQNLDRIKEMNQPIVLCCRSGARSGMAVKILKKEGIAALNGGSWNGLQE